MATYRTCIMYQIMVFKHASTLSRSKEGKISSFALVTAVLPCFLWDHRLLPPRIDTVLRRAPCPDCPPSQGAYSTQPMLAVRRYTVGWFGDVTIDLGTQPLLAVRRYMVATFAKAVAGLDTQLAWLGVRRGMAVVRLGDVVRWEVRRRWPVVVVFSSSFARIAMRR